MFLKIMHEKIKKHKMMKLKKNMVFSKMIKREFMICFETFVQKQNDNLFKSSKKKVDKRKSRKVISRSANNQ